MFVCCVRYRKHKKPEWVGCVTDECARLGAAIPTCDIAGGRELIFCVCRFCGFPLVVICD